ncbi:uncharacterized protein LOC111622693 [Centruroides sculpturatus]|uniref:uncharacterized protein LOC111622693 n=1 Tax=Centruroides sculpturatus TaxID=218467 RepID=UPI000C6D9574|nr:uncharacterized protein LOC111622693 [Centruroides sculpturatus]
MKISIFIALLMFCASNATEDEKMVKLRSHIRLCCEKSTDNAQFHEEYVTCLNTLDDKKKTKFDEMCENRLKSDCPLKYKDCEKNGIVIEKKILYILFSELSEQYSIAAKKGKDATNQYLMEIGAIKENEQLNDTCDASISAGLFEILAEDKPNCTNWSVHDK